MNWANIIRPRIQDGAAPNAWAIVLVSATLVVTALIVMNLLASNTRSSDAQQRSALARAVQTSTAPTAVADCHGNTAARLVKVSLSAQVLTLCEKETPVGISPVTTGRVALGDGTPLGTWRINSRETNRYLTGADYRVYVHYWLPFFHDFGFHDSPWQRFAYGDTATYKTRGSRGCIHVPSAEMGKLYRWARVGTTVTILP